MRVALSGTGLDRLFDGLCHPIIFAYPISYRQRPQKLEPQWLSFGGPAFFPKFAAMQIVRLAFGTVSGTSLARLVLAPASA
jgi:hypothetical protein